MEQFKFIDWVKQECSQNSGSVVFQPIDGLFEVLRPEHSDFINDLSGYSIKTVSIEEAYEMGFEEMANWSQKNDKLIYSDFGVLFNIGSSKQD